MEKINNFLFSGRHCGLKKTGAADVGFMKSPLPLRVSAVFTRNRVKAAPVIISRKHSKNTIKALIVNSGNANACNGRHGIRDAMDVLEAVSAETGIEKSNIFVCSTGVIGERLNAAAIVEAVPSLAEGATPEGFGDFARAIMTTDTFPKTFFRKIKIDGKEFSVMGAAKGSGMIMPDMATMLAFLFTDIPLAKDDADKIFRYCVERSFNSISVDGDTSTNDTAAMFYPNAGAAKTLKAPSALNAVKDVILEACGNLAEMIVRDGEGATKLVRVSVVNAASEKEAKKAGMTVANSPLFKTMITGEDLNWGRIVAAVGRSAVRMKASGIDVYINGKPVAENCSASERLDKSSENTLLAPAEINVGIDLKFGKSSWTVLTCNLTKEYIDINASYRS